MPGERTFDRTGEQFSFEYIFLKGKLIEEFMQISMLYLSLSA